MSMWSHTDRIYCDAEDVRSAARRAATEEDAAAPGSFEQGVYYGVRFVFEAMSNHERMDMPPTFFDMLEVDLAGGYTLDREPPSLGAEADEAVRKVPTFGGVEEIIKAIEGTICPGKPEKKEEK